MAAPAQTATSRFASKVHRLRFTVSGANDGNVDFTAHRPLASLVAQLRGSYTSGTVALQGSLDGSTFVALPTAVSFTALGVKSVAVADLGFLFYRVAASSMHANNDLTLDIVMKEL